MIKLEQRVHDNTYHGCKLRYHMSAESDFEIGQSTFRMHVTVCPDTVHDETVVGDRGLESL